MALIPSLGTALSGMKTAQSQLSIISSNVANVDTEGYTRKIAQQKNVILAGYSQGVSIGEVTRKVNEGLLKSYLAANSLNGNLAAQNSYLSKTEILLGTPEGENSVSANVAALQTAFDSFASDVTSSAGRYNLLNQADTLTSRMNYISEEIQKLRGDADMNIAADVDEINKLLDTLDNLNDQIVKYTLLGYDGTADLLDQRDQALRSLSEKMDITYFKRDNGEIVVQTTNGITLLDNDPHYLSHNAVAQASPTTTYAAGGIDGIYVNGEDITASIKDGSIKGLIEVRDVILPSLQSQLDELAGALKAQINSVHNQGTAYHNTPSELTGTRTFIDPDKQQIKIAEGDVRFVIFDTNGKQVATTSLKGGIGFDSGSISEMAQEIQDWLRSADGPNLPQAEVGVDKNGKLFINTGDSNYTFSIIDEAGSAAGTAQQPAKIEFDSNGNGLYDREFEGFSSFFGLNDFFVDNSSESVYDSKVMSRSVNLGLKDTVTLSFSNSSSGLNFGTITISPNDSLQDIVNSINENPALNGQISAALVPNGDGYMLRISNASGEQLEIAENVAPGAQPSNLLEKIGLQPSNVNAAISLDIRSDLQTSPEKIAGGSPQFDSATGEYVQSPAANNIANALGEVFSASFDFKQSGTIAQTKTSLSNYAATFVGNIASQTSNSEASLSYQTELTNSISLKEAQISGVDIDEELGQMIIFQQTYAACAQAFTASKEILDMLLSIV